MTKKVSKNNFYLQIKQLLFNLLRYGGIKHDAFAVCL